MTFLRLKATFGKLDGDILELQSGLNILYAPNESGKSTWCAFLLAMLYGIDGSQRDTKTALADKNKYQPWNGKRMEGRIDLIWQGKAVTIERSSTERAPLAVFRAYYTDSGAPVEELTAGNCGQTLTGVSRSIFARSAFLAQDAHAFSYDAALEDQLQQLVSTGEQTVSYAQAKQKLVQLQNRCRHHKTGLIPQLRTQLVQCEEQIQQLSTLQREQNTAESELEHLTQQYQAQIRCNQLDHQTALDSANKKAMLAQEYADDLKNRTAALPTYAQLQHWQEQLIQNPDKNVQATKRKARVLCLGIAAFGICIAIFLRKNLFMAGGCIAIAAVICLLLQNWQKHRSTGMQSLPEEMQKAFPGAASVPEVQQEIQKALQLQLEQEHAAEQAMQMRQSAEQLASLLPQRPQNEKALQLEAAIQLCRQKLSALEAKQTVFPSFQVLSAQKSSLQDRLERLEMHYEAFGLALEALQHAADRLQARFAPPLRRLAGQYLAHLTENAHEELEIDRQMRIHLQDLDHVVSHPSFCYSGAACDQIWLALRLAVMQLLTTSETPCILDDALVRFDDARMEAALKLLQQLSAQRQILLFSCQQREKNYFNKQHPEGVAYGKE